jgi:leader peptidase (prepilin peptidase)/N-methyltransferase
MPELTPVPVLPPSGRNTSRSVPADRRRPWDWRGADVATGIVLALLAIVATGPSPAVVPAVGLAVATPVLWRVDVTERRLPNALVFPCACLAGGAVVASAARHGAWPVEPLLCAAVAGAFFLVLSIGGGMGMGDVKLAVVLATVLGLVRVDAVVIAALVAFFSGGVAGLVVHLRSRQRSLPFGPFLLAGFWTALVLAG